MADLTITPANVVPASDAIVEFAEANEVIDAGEVVYLTGGKLALADANVDAATAKAVGIAVGSAEVAGQRIGYIKQGDVDVGSALTAGAAYVVSATAGKIAPEADLASTNYVTLVGFARDADTLIVNLYATGVQHA